MDDYSKLNFLSFDEMANLYAQEEKLVFVEVKNTDEFVGKYEDLPDIIVGLSRVFNEKDMNVISVDTGKTILSTHGRFLSKCDSKIRQEMIERLVDLQTNKKEVKDFKIIRALDLMDFCDSYKESSLLEK